MLLLHYTPALALRLCDILLAVSLGWLSAVCLARYDRGGHQLCGLSLSPLGWLARGLHGRSVYRGGAGTAALATEPVFEGHRLTMWWYPRVSSVHMRQRVDDMHRGRGRGGRTGRAGLRQ